MNNHRGYGTRTRWLSDLDVLWSEVEGSMWGANSLAWDLPDGLLKTRLDRVESLMHEALAELNAISEEIYGPHV